MTENFNRLVALLRELFQMDRPDLDFGIYRIMNQKRKDVSAFLENDLLPQVRKELSKVNSGGTVLAELNATIKQAREIGADPEQLPKVQKLREQLAAYDESMTSENEIYSHLYNFFRRYYKDGDFLSLRRYKKDVYAIPYEGEEVKLHWANADQYYIKSAENFRDYAFLVGEAPAQGQEDARKRVHFKLVEADTEVANNKAQKGKERRFMLCGDSPIMEEDGELIIRFEYKSSAKKQNQKSLNEAAVKTILGNAAFVEWVRLLAREDNGRSCLEKHLNIYTARNTFDYFIHKDLGGFLRRELDFYIKNEVLFLDDIESQTFEHVAAQLTQIRILRRIAHKIIRFLEQIENFQKKLWLKKKFVVETNYLITLDRVPEELYPEIAANDAQREEWVRLFAIDEIKKEMMKPGYSTPLTVEFLKSNNKLVLDTHFFERQFKSRLVGNIDDFDDKCSGLLVHSENFQALNFLQSRYKNKIDCIYIDPPYNTGEDGFNYKDGYIQSSWVSMMTERLSLARRIMSLNSSCFCSIDDLSCCNLWKVMDSVFQRDNYVGSYVWKRRSSSGLASTPLSIDHEYILVFSKSINTIKFSGLTKTKDNYPYWDEKTQRNYASTDLTIGATSEQRPNQFFPITNPRTGAIYQANPHRVWRFFPETMQQVISDDLIIWPDEAEGNLQRPRYKTYFDPDAAKTKPCSSWIETSSVNDREVREDENDYELEILSTGMNQEGGRSLQKITGNKIFAYPKPVSLIRSLVRASTSIKMQVVDFFGGSGTTGHAVINLNREDSGERKYLLVEMGEHFDTVLKPRITKVVYSDSWKEGKPTSRNSGISHCCKYLRLESYEDTLNNLVLKRSPAQLSLLADTPSLKEEYMLSYMMDLEAQGSASLLNVDTFTDPWNYTLKIATGSAGETRTRPVDLVETFNYLLGLTVIRRVVIRGIEVIEGTNPEGEKVLVIWRNTAKVSNEQLNEFFRKQDFRPREGEFDYIYVNGDSNLENFKRPDETWKVRLTEEEFKRLMFDVEDV